MSQGLRYPDPPLDDGVVRLRPWSEGDVACVLEAAADPAIPEATSVPRDGAVESAREFLRLQGVRRERGEALSLAVVTSAADEARGLVALVVRPQAGVAGIGYWVVPSARGRGLAGRAVRLLSAWALRTGTARVEAWVEPGNEASRRVLSKVGFRCEGRLRSFLVVGGRRTDAVVYSRVVGDVAG